MLVHDTYLLTNVPWHLQALWGKQNVVSFSISLSFLTILFGHLFHIIHYYKIAQR